MEISHVASLFTSVENWNKMEIFPLRSWQEQQQGSLLGMIT